MKKTGEKGEKGKKKGETVRKTEKGRKGEKGVSSATRVYCVNGDMFRGREWSAQCLTSLLALETLRTPSTLEK